MLDFVLAYIINYVIKQLIGDDIMMEKEFLLFFRKTSFQNICIEKNSNTFHNIYNLYPIFSNCRRISASRSCDRANKPESSFVRRSIFAAKGSESSACAAIPT